MRRHNAAFCKEHFVHHCDEQVRRAIHSHRMLEPGSAVLVAVSGGKDSLALWEILVRLGYEADGLYLGLGIGDYSDESGVYTREFADAARASADRGRPRRRRTGYTIPQAAAAHPPRAVRRAAACRSATSSTRRAIERGYDVVATGHNLDDEAAVLLGNVLRWDAGYLGRQHPVLPAAPGFVRKVKPLVRLGERETAAYCVLQGIDYQVEECPMAAGNRHLGYKEVLNALEDRSPGIKAAFLFGFLERGHARFADEAEQRARRAAASAPCAARRRPATVCAFCRLRSRSAPGRPAHRRSAGAADVSRAFARGRPRAARRRQAPSPPDHPRRRRRVPHPRGRARARRHHRRSADGVTVRTTQDARLTAVRPTLAEYVLEMPRGAQVIYPEGPRADPDPRRRLPGRARARVGRRFGRAHAGAAARGRRARARAPATRSATTSPAVPAPTSRASSAPTCPLDVEVRDVYDGIERRRPRPHPARPARALAGREARRGGAASRRDPARVPADDRAGRPPARGARRLAVRDGRVPRGAAAHLARRRPVGAARPPHGGAHRLPHPRAPARAGTERDEGVNFLDLVVLAVAAGAGWVGYRIGLRPARHVVGRARGRARRRRAASSTTWPTRSRGSPPRTRLLGVTRVRRPGRGRRRRRVGLRDRRRAAAAARPRVPARSDRATASRGGAARCRRRARAHVAAHPGARELAGVDRRGRCATRRSRALIDRVAPAPPSESETLGRLVGDQPFPEVFDTLIVTRRRRTARRRASPPRRPRASPRSIVLVEGQACDRIQEGTGFVAGPEPRRHERARGRGGATTRSVHHHRRPAPRRRRGRVRPRPRPRGAARARARRSRRSPLGEARVDAPGSRVRSPRRWSAAPGAGAHRRADRRPRGTDIYRTHADRAGGVRARRGHRARRLGRTASSTATGDVVGVLFAYDLSRRRHRLRAHPHRARRRCSPPCSPAPPPGTVEHRRLPRLSETERAQRRGTARRPGRRARVAQEEQV